MEFSAEQDQVWATLITNQLPKVKQHACSLYLDGYSRLQLPADRIPSLQELNDEITPRTGWRAVRTGERYSDAVPWYQAFAGKQFLVTDYMRGWEELEFTPEPDMFHDIFGHLPFMTIPEYTELQELFAPAFEKANADQREDIKRLAWFSTEFGLILENGEMKAFGAGLISSMAELENVAQRKVPFEPFTFENVTRFDKAVWSFNEVMFYFDSIESLKAELGGYFTRL